MHDSMSNLKELQPEVKTKLASQGIRTTTQLLEHTRTEMQCAELAHEVGTTSCTHSLKKSLSTNRSGIACPRLLRRHSGLSKQRSWPPGSLLIGKSIKIPLICL